ncbi:MAG: peptidase M14, partial [Acidobacteriia bacterium 12-62-4]
EQKTSLDWFGKNNAKYFDQMGYSYFTREVYDAFFPGYGAAWPAYHGTIAMTYENAAVRGMLYNRLDGSAYTFKESVKRHFVTSVATCEAAAMHRAELLENFWTYRKTAIEEGKNEPVKGYILSRKGDGSAADKLAELLVTQGVEVGKLASGAQGAPDGSYLVSLAQPAKRLIRTLLDKKVEMEPDFLAEQERRRKKKLGDEIYDVTAWSLPLLYGVEAIPVTSLPGGATPFTGARPKPAAPAKAQVAYFVPWGTQAAGQFLTAALRAGVKIHTLDKAFVQNGRTFDRGTLAVKVKENPENVHDLVLKAQGYAEIVASDSAWVESGINLVSRSSFVMKKPAIALAWDRPVAANAAGAVKWMLERQYGYPVTAVRMNSLAGADLSKFNVLILPDAAGDYTTALGAGAIRRIKEWV